jgi:hypothetical protein
VNIKSHADRFRARCRISDVKTCCETTEVLPFADTREVSIVTRPDSHMNECFNFPGGAANRTLLSGANSGWTTNSATRSYFQ